MIRRKLLYAAVATLVLAGAGAAVAAHIGQPDAELIALCTTFHRARRGQKHGQPLPGMGHHRQAGRS